MREAPNTKARFLLALPIYEPKINTYVNQHVHKLPHTMTDDLKQELLEVLFKSCDKYDPDCGAKFNTFFWHNVHNAFVNLVAKAFTQKRQADLFTVSLDGLRDLMQTEGWVDLSEAKLAAAIEARSAVRSAEVEWLDQVEVLKRIEDLTPHQREKIFGEVA